MACVVAVVKSKTQASEIVLVVSLELYLRATLHMRWTIGPNRMKEGWTWRD